MSDRDPTDLELDDWGKLGQKLRESREYLGLSQAQVAAAMELQRPSISSIEAGKRRVTVLELKRFADLYRRPYSYFVGDDEEAEAEPDEALGAIFRASKDLSVVDRDQVRRFAEFLRQAGKAPTRKDAD